MHTFQANDDDDGAPKRLDQAIPAYLRWLAAMHYAANTITLRRQELARFASWCAAAAASVVLVTDATREVLERYRLAMHEQRKLSASSQHSYLVALKHFFAYLVEQRILEENPAAELAVPRRRRPLPRDVLAAHEVEEVIGLIDVRTDLGLRDRALFEVLYSTGLRRAEVLSLDVRDVDTGDLVVRVRRGKGARERVVPLGRRAAAWVTRYVSEARPRLASLNCRRLFVSRRGDGLSERQLTQIGHDYVAAATTKSGACHVFRHSVATLMLMRGADVRHIQELLGHEDIRTTERYTRVAIRELREAHARFHPAA